MRTILSTSLLIIAATIGPCQAEPHNISKLFLISGRPVVDGVFINGNGPYRFLLDTGAQSNQLEAGLARKLGVVPTYRVQMDTAGGAVMVGGAKIRTMSVGTVEAGDQEVLMTSLEGIHELSQDIHGVLGQEFLSHFDYLLDLRGRRLTFGALQTAGTKTTFENMKGRIGLQTSAGKLILDSGVDLLVLFRAPDRGMTSQLVTASGTTDIRSAGTVRLRLGDREYKRAAIYAPGDFETNEKGLLPLSLFRSVFVSNSGGYVVLDGI